MSTEAYIEMVYRNLQGELSPEEFGVLNEMTGKDSALAELRLGIEDAWDVSGGEKTIVTEEETNQLFQRITTNETREASIFSLKNLITGIAAIFVLGLSAIWLLRDQAEIYDGVGLVRLADNSMVEMREGSRLEVTSFDDAVRNVTLFGEAYFDIEEDQDRPFIISVKNAKVEVLGTEFLVKETRKSVFVAVEEGRVRFSNGLTVESMDLTAGMKAESNEQGEIIEVSYQNLMGWKSGTYEFEEQELAEIVEELSIIFNSIIVIENQQLLNCNISAILTAENLGEILNQLAAQLEMDARQEGQKWILSGGKCK